MAKDFKKTQADLFLSVSDDIENSTNNDIADTKSDIIGTIDTVNITDAESDMIDIINANNSEKVYKIMLRLDNKIADDVKCYMKIANSKSINLAMQDLILQGLEQHVDKIKVYKKLFTK